MEKIDNNHDLTGLAHLQPPLDDLCAPLPPPPRRCSVLQAAQEGTLLSRLLARNLVGQENKECRRKGERESDGCLMDVGGSYRKELLFNTGRVSKDPEKPL